LSARCACVLHLTLSCFPKISETACLLSLVFERQCSNRPQRYTAPYYEPPCAVVCMRLYVYVCVCVCVCMCGCVCMWCARACMSNTVERIHVYVTERRRRMRCCRMSQARIRVRSVRCGARPPERGTETREVSTERKRERATAASSSSSSSSLSSSSSSSSIDRFRLVRRRWRIANCWRCCRTNGGVVTSRTNSHDHRRCGGTPQ